MAPSNTPDEALEIALHRCNQRSGDACRPYAVNDQVVYQPQPGETRVVDPRYGNLRPSSTAEEAKKAYVGFAVGNRHPDFELTAENGSVSNLESFRAKVVMLQFTASWCPYCNAEVEDLAALYERVKKTPGFKMAVIGSVEPAATTRDWLRNYSKDLPLYDCGLSDTNTRSIRYRNGVSRHAGVPHTFVLDQHGVIVYSRQGGLSDDDWRKLETGLRQLLVDG